MGAGGSVSTKTGSGSGTGDDVCVVARSVGPMASSRPIGSQWAMAKRPDIRERIETYREHCGHADAEGVLVATRQALADRHPLLVARGAEIAGDRLIYALEADLIAAYARFLDQPVKRDPGCMAKGTIARALVALDCQDAEFFIAGIRYRQPEPVWGGSADTAVDLRTSCAIGLAATSHPRALIHLVDLLHDPEPHARAGAARAIACTQPLAAEAVLRSKALAGDPDPEVTGECLSALLQVASEDAIALVGGFLDAADTDVSALAALALGESHLEAALELLRGRWDAEPFKRERHRMLLRAAALHRSELALDWLLDMVITGDRISAERVVTEIAAYRNSARARDALRAAVTERGEPAVTACFEGAFGAGS